MTRYPFLFTLSLYSLQVQFFRNVHKYFNYNPFLYWPHEFQQRPRNCMHKYWCLIRYPFWFTSSLHSLKIIFYSAIYMDIITQYLFVMLKDKDQELQNMFIWYFPNWKKNHCIQSTLKKSSFEISWVFLVLNFNILRFLPKYLCFFDFHLESNFVIVSIGVW